MKILYVPGHIQSALEAAAGDVKDLFSPEALANIASPEDVAFYCYVNLRLDKVIPEEIAHSLPMGLYQTPDGAPPAWFGNHSAGEGRMKEVNRIVNEYCINDNAPQLNLDGMKLTCDLLDQDTIRFTHVELAPGEVNENSVGGLHQLYDRVIQQLYSFFSFEDLAKLKLFAGYLKATQATLATV